jgi:hypothetical protein
MNFHSVTDLQGIIILKNRMTSVWAKADMIMNLGIYRLDCFKVGWRKYDYPTVTAEDLQGVKRAILYGLGMGASIPGDGSAI